MFFEPNQSIEPLNVALKYDPPTIALYYKKKKVQNKKYMYKILLNDLILIKNATTITKKLFSQHPLYLNDKILPFEQVLYLVEKLVENYQQADKNNQATIQEESYYDETNDNNLNQNSIQNILNDDEFENNFFSTQDEGQYSNTKKKFKPDQQNDEVDLDYLQNNNINNKNSNDCNNQMNKKQAKNGGGGGKLGMLKQLSNERQNSNDIKNNNNNIDDEFLIDEDQIDF